MSMACAAARPRIDSYGARARMVIGGLSGQPSLFLIKYVVRHFTGLEQHHRVGELANLRRLHLATLPLFESEIRGPPRCDATSVRTARENDRPSRGRHAAS